MSSKKRTYSFALNIAKGARNVKSAFLRQNFKNKTYKDPKSSNLDVLKFHFKSKEKKQETEKHIRKGITNIELHDISSN